MSLGAWQIIVTVIGLFVGPYFGAKLAIRRLEFERDHARLDELRNVLDDAAAQIAVCERTANVVLGAINGRGGLEEKLDQLDDAIQPLIGTVGRLALRVDEDPILVALRDVVLSIQDRRNALRRYMSSPARKPEYLAEHRRAERAFIAAHAGFLREGRELVGPSMRALKSARSRHFGDLVQEQIKHARARKATEVVERLAADQVRKALDSGEEAA